MLDERKFEVGDKVYSVYNRYSTYKLSIDVLYTIKEIHYVHSTFAGHYRYFILEGDSKHHLTEQFVDEFYYLRMKLAKIRQRIYDKRRQGILH